MAEWSIQHMVFVLLSVPVELVLHTNYTITFWVMVFAIAFFNSIGSALLVVFGGLLAILASCGVQPSSLPRYRGPLDVFFGRQYKASSETPDQPANNNVSLATFHNKMVVAYRKADSHFASPQAKMVVAVADPKELDHWEVIWDHSTGEDDLREMMLFVLNDKLFLYYARLAPHKRGFSPRGMHFVSTSDLKTWTEPVELGRVSEIPWDIKVRKDRSGTLMAYKASYIGNHYSADAVCTVLFEKSADGETWSPVGERSEVYTGGISEVSFDFTDKGDLIAIGRNEDGDHTGFGSQLYFAKADDLAHWHHLEVSLPQRFDSPRMINVQGDIMLFARFAREGYNQIPEWCPFWLQRLGNLIIYSTLPKSAAVYRISPPDENGKFGSEPISVVRFFEATHGDTGFFSCARAPDAPEDDGSSRTTPRHATRTLRGSTDNSSQQISMCAAANSSAADLHKKYVLVLSAKRATVPDT
eukprot:CAMPEP_0206444822 /NCGR_PEP_ID=MMETSP0324_2-20121206/15132_1 /ASSEMBLY_ACC=CAM_ASM_000836 /TAXON_ID=2866 /ORGANISM="Crypthecodinium cohnii, Strain Seligo" /LENGTH=470 /DNA_ID=CAMNT_0053912901 /DNA_START=516 /DNA_END=1929 /DNA_ORIENTATION=+